ncbi:MAG TPA: DeoR/GlpR family DNA-binding transcription regulator [Novosphingobium sp.]|nr:DeoR/GlpR family DNA-binding transcription regulator [Novosphingobium sp.]
MALEPGKKAGKRSAEESGRQAQARVPVELRHQHMMQAFAEQGFISVIDMAELIGVSTMTIRRDLDLLEQAGKVMRIHGGAVLAAQKEDSETERKEDIFDRRLAVNAPAKRAIARAVADLVGADPAIQSIGLDTGTTVLTAAHLLMGGKGLRFVTNNLRAALLLSGGESRVYMLGGEVRVPELSVVGPGAIKALQNQYLDVALIGVSGLDAQGLYDFSPEDTEVKTVLMDNASKVVVVCDASKFERRALARIAPLERIHVLVSEAAPPPALAAALAAAGVQVVVAGS